MEAKMTVFYRLVTPAGFSDEDVSTLAAARERKKQFGYCNSTNPSHQEYWKKMEKMCKVVRVIEIIEECDMDKGE